MRHGDVVVLQAEVAHVYEDYPGDEFIYVDEARFRLRYLQRTAAQLENDILARGLSFPGVAQTKVSLANTLLLDDLAQIFHGSVVDAMD